MVHRSVWLALLACAIVAGSAGGAVAATLSVRSPAIAAKLRLAAEFTPRRTDVRVRGRARVRTRGAALVLLRCADARCVRYARRGRALRRLRHGGRRLAVRLRVGPSPFARIELRLRRRVLAHATLRRPAAAPSRPPSAAPTRPASPSAPGEASVSATPPLVPAYDPAIPDYTVACEPSRTVRVVAEGATVAIDGSSPASGRLERTLALAAGQAFGFSIDGRSHSVRCLPRDWLGWTVTRDGTPEVEWMVLTPRAGDAGYTVIADDHGVPVWWRAGTPPLQDGRVLPDGSVAVGRVTDETYGRHPYERVALDGTSLGELDTVGTSADPHDLELLPNGDALMVRYVPRDHVDLSSLGGPADATVLDGEIQEVTPQHELVWSWNSADHIGLAETTWPLSQVRANVDGRDAYDLVHLNSIQQDGDGVLLSARHADAVYRIRRDDGGVDWKLGGAPRAESLDFLAGPLGPADFGGQHQARRLPDGTITLHDNGTRKGRSPRALRIAVDPLARTATVLERMVDPRVRSSICCGGATRLAGGDWLMSWGYARTITELTPSGRPVLTLTLDEGFSYRAQSVPSTLVSRAALRAGMDAMHPR